MNQPLKILCVSILAILAVAVSANAYYNDCSLSNAWNVTGGAIVSNQDLFTLNGTNLYIPSSATVSNSGTSAGQKVWTDFLTIPRRFQFSQGTAPAADLNATAQFYVNSTGYWETISQEGTQVCDHVIGGGEYPVVDVNPANYYHVSVLNDYPNSKWSLFVNGLPLATNLTSLAAGETGHKWFKVDNLGNQTNDNVCWLDNFEVTNRMPLAGAQSAGGQPLTNNVIPGTDIPQALAFAGFGSFADPRPTNETIGAVGDGISLAFGRTDNPDGRKFVVFGGVNPGLSDLSSNGVVVGGSFAKPLSESDTRRFYKLVTISADGLVSLTNNETYAVYKKPLTGGFWQAIGVPVGYSDYTLGGPLGKQLGAVGGADKIVVYNGDADINSYTWTGTDWGDGSGDKVILPGRGLLIRSAVSGNAIFAGLQQTNQASIVIAAGWNSLAWPYDNSDSQQLPQGHSGDILYLTRNNSPLPAKYMSDGWHQGRYGTGTNLTALTPPIQAGEGLLIQASQTGTWGPTRTP